MIEPTPSAIEAVARSQAAARRFDQDVRIRLARDGAGVRFELVEEPAPGDEAVPCGEVTLLVEAGLDGVLDTGEHSLPILTPRP